MFNNAWANVAYHLLMMRWHVLKVQLSLTITSNSKTMEFFNEFRIFKLIFTGCCMQEPSSRSTKVLSIWRNKFSSIRVEGDHSSVSVVRRLRHRHAAQSRSFAAPRIETRQRQRSRGNYSAVTKCYLFEENAVKRKLTKMWRQQVKQRPDAAANDFKQELSRSGDKEPQSSVLRRAVFNPDHQLRILGECFMIDIALRWRWTVFYFSPSFVCVRLSLATECDWIKMAVFWWSTSSDTLHVAENWRLHLYPLRSPYASI